jgi:hypothetical protein
VSDDALRRIRSVIVAGDYDLTRHAVEEMAEDRLLVADVECALLTGELVKIESDALRGSRFTVIGRSEDGRAEVGVVGRFTETGIYLVITVYEVF